MEGLGAYILSVTAASILCGLLCALGGKGSWGPLLKMLCGVVLTAVILQPVVKTVPIPLAGYLKGLEQDAAAIVASGIGHTETQTRERITEGTRTYILEKAKQLGLEITASVTLDPEDPVPASVVITGDASPYARSALTKILTEDLDIPVEGQIWK